MAAKADQSASNKDNPVTVVVSPASGSQTPSVQLAATVGSGKAPPLLQTVPGTVLIAIPQEKTSSTGRKKAVGTKHTGNATSQPPPTKSNTLPSKYKVTAPRRMETRSRGKPQEKESSKSHKRKLPFKSSRPAPDNEKSAKKAKFSQQAPDDEKKAKKGKFSQAPDDGKRAKKAEVSQQAPDNEKSAKNAKVSRPAPDNEKMPKKANVSLSPDSKVKKISKSKTVSPKKSIPQKNGMDTNPNVAVPPQTSTTAVKVEGSPNTFDVKVKLTPSQSKPKRKAPKDGGDTNTNIDMKELMAKAKKDAKLVDKLLKDRKMLRMRVFRANKKNEKLMISIQLEQKMHKETRQTLKAIIQGLQLDLKTV